MIMPISPLKMMVYILYGTSLKANVLDNTIFNVMGLSWDKFFGPQTIKPVVNTRPYKG
jgi:hypothetical protein